ncbi:archease [Candidatus Pacearchaeota archaeon]|nr:archease [Candidatus Pacearchaeota archaeon]
MKNKKFEFLEHTGEIKFQAFGKTLNEAFENSILAISSFLSKEQKIKNKIIKKISVNGTDIKSLLYNFLDEMIYLFDAELFIPKNAEVTINGNKLTAIIFGDKTLNYEGLDYIKSVTYSDMIIEKNEKGYIIQVVLDV